MSPLDASRRGAIDLDVEPPRHAAPRMKVEADVRTVMHSTGIARVVVD